LGRLEIYADLLKRWNSRINLVAPSTLPNLWTRHIADSAQVFELAPPEARSWVDLGTGGGFPGLVVAVLAAELAPDLAVTCIESDQRKATFLRTVLRETGIKAEVRAERIEAAPAMNADVVSARALAALDRLLPMVQRHLKPGGIALFPKGDSYRSEVQQALESWRFAADTYPSQTNPNAVILKVGDIRRA
jgi:16S rRNA (guanine527-N7)-methyltransferase